MNSCRKSPFNITPVTFTVPQGFPQPAYNFSDNPLTEEGFQLGKKLFFDGRLSLDSAFPCSSCHQPVAAFTTFEHDRSHGYNRSHTLRNSPGLFNIAWMTEYTQDGGAKSLDDIYRGHITNAHEMAENVPEVLHRLTADDTYKQMFKSAFGDEKITEDRMYKAITQYVLNLVSADSKYDKVKRGGANFDALEQTGYTVFQAKCATCHKEPMFTDYTYRNNGLSLDSSLNDHGRMRVTGSAADDLKFRVPSLRNCDLTSYYGHDGRYSVFRAMIQHYKAGSIVKSSTLDPLLANGISISTTEEDALVAFIRTLTDSTFLNNPRFRP
jgi:cytochrome c peroxidase